MAENFQMLGNFVKPLNVLFQALLIHCRELQDIKFNIFEYMKIQNMGIFLGQLHGFIQALSEYRLTVLKTQYLA